MVPSKAVSPMAAEPDHRRSLVEPVDALDFYADPDPFDKFPWTCRRYVEGYPPERTDRAFISTPNGKRLDGTQHTYWSVAGDLWLPIAIIICEAVNAAAHERYGTPIPEQVVTT